MSYAPAPLSVVFRTEAVTKVYRTGAVEVQALHGVDLTHYEGELVLLLGASGSGKSTLLNILGALDSATGITALEALVEVNRDLGTATALITHNAGIRKMRIGWLTWPTG